MSSKCPSVPWIVLCLTISTAPPVLAQSSEPSPGGEGILAEGGDAVPSSGPPSSSAAAEIPGAAPTADEDESGAATQVASFAITQLKNSPAVVTVISGEDIRSSGARDLVDILTMVPGYFVGLDTLGVVGPGFRGLWGHEGKILLMIDGKEMNELLFSSMQLGNEFPVELIERVEVVRGPGSVIYGGSAELSVINVITRGLQGGTVANVTATYGQLPSARSFSTGYGRRRLTLSGRYVSEVVPGLSAFASASVGQGQRSVREFVDSAQLATSLEGRSALDPAVLQLGVGYKELQASFLYHRLATTTMTSGLGEVLPAPVGVRFDSYHGELSGNFRVGDRLEIVPRINYTHQTPWSSPGDPTADHYYHKSVRRLRGRLLGRWAALDQLQVTAGADAMLDHARLLSPVGAGLQIPFTATGTDRVSYETFGGYVELFSENPLVNVAVGARYDHHSAVGGALVPRLVLLRTFGPVSLKGLFSMSFRAPGVENVNVGVGIRPERTRIYEFEAAIDFTAHQRLSANVFDLGINAPIAYSVDPITAEEAYMNLGKQGTRGFEVAYRLRLPVVRLEANYSFYEPSISQNTPPYTVAGHPQQFLGAPAHRGSIRATIRPFSRFGVTPSAVILGDRYAMGPPDPLDQPTAVRIPAQVLGNVFVYYDDIGMKGFRLGVGIYNVLGTDYRFVRPYNTEHAPLPGLDREIMVQLSYLFEKS